MPIRVLVLFVLLASAGLVGTSRGQQRLALVPCGPEGARQEMLCGSLEVAENYGIPDGRTISLSIKVLPAIAPRPESAALFELAGGPGIAATGDAEFFLGPGRSYRQSRDVVLVDQRGTGASHPLRCPALESHGPLDEMYPLDEVADCRKALAAGADLAQYTTSNSARDLERVRAALGYDAIDLSGISYGTELARAYLRQYPARVRSAVLIGPPSDDMRTPLPHAANAQRALDLLFYECQTDPLCSAEYPDLRAEWDAVLARVDRGVRVSRGDRAMGATADILIERGPFAEAFRNMFTTAAGRRSLPRMIHRAASGDFGPFLDALPDGGGGRFAEGLYLSIACSEGTLRIDPDDVRRFTAGTFLGDYRVTQQMRACAAWSSAPAPAVVSQEEPASHPPVLVISGEFDATTPPAYAREVCAALGNCRLVEIPGMGHGPFDLDAWTGGECFDRLILDFFARGGSEGLDTSCVAKMAPPPFVAARE